MLPHKSCEAFHAVIETGSFDLAAAKLCITASAVTLRVQALEKQLGHILILRERPCRVTNAGQALLEYLQHQRLMESNLLQQLQGQQQQFFKFALAINADTLATWLFPSIYQCLIAQNIRLDLMIDDQSQTHQLLENGLVNACISAEQHPMKGCVAEYLGSMQYQMVASPSFIQQWFAQGIKREAFRHAPAVIFNHKDRLHEDCTLQLFGLNMQHYPYHFIPSSTAFLDAIELGLGYGMLPVMQIEAQLKSGALIEVLPSARTSIDLYWHHWKQQSPALNTLTEVILSQAQARLNQTRTGFN